MKLVNFAVPNIIIILSYNLEHYSINSPVFHEWKEGLSDVYVPLLILVHLAGQIVLFTISPVLICSIFNTFVFYVVFYYSM